MVGFVVIPTRIVWPLLKHLKHIRGSHSCLTKCNSSLQSGVYKDKYITGSCKLIHLHAFRISTLNAMTCIPHIKDDSEGHKPSFKHEQKIVLESASSTHVM